MNHLPLKFDATPSITMKGAWVGLVVDRITGAVYHQTIITYRSRDEARFGARRRWVAALRAASQLLASVDQHSQGKA